MLDTHAWLWWIAGDVRLTAVARHAIDSADRIGVATVSAMEVARLSEKGRVALDRPIATWVKQALALPRVVALELTAAIAVQAGQLDRERFPGDPADRIIYASALATSATLLTRDAAIRAFDPRRTAWD